MREIGGYFGLELKRSSEFHAEAIPLNSGRSCLAYLLAAEGVERIYLPYYLCDTLISVVVAAGVECCFYQIGVSLELAEEIVPTAGERLLYVNYFGLKDDYVEDLSQRLGEALIVDNSQAFFSVPIPGADTFYSPRKFFGVADGGYLYTDKYLDEHLDTALSAENAGHLLGRLDSDAQAWYLAYQRAEEAIGKQGLMRMSRLSRSLLGAVDYASALSRRSRNYDYLHAELAQMNGLDVAERCADGPMIYPFMCASAGLRQALLRERVYVASYWQEVLGREGISATERMLVEHCIPLPVDQRYDVEDMRRIARIIKENINE